MVSISLNCFAINSLCEWLFYLLIFILNALSAASQTQLTSSEPTTDTEPKNVRGITTGKGARQAMMRAKERLSSIFD